MKSNLGMAYVRSFLGDWTVRHNPGCFQPYQAYQYVDNVPNKGNFLNFPSLLEAAAFFKKPYRTFAPNVIRTCKRQGKAYGYFWERA